MYTWYNECSSSCNKWNICSIMETGLKDLKIPNVLKVYYGEIEKENNDVFFTPIYMKKNRPAYRMTIAYKKEDMTKLQKIIFRETTYGKIKAKKVINDDEVYVYPEYESAKEISLKNNIQLKELYK